MNASLIAEQVAKYAPSQINNAEDHRFERYFLDKVLIPESTVKISGDIFDFKIFKEIKKQREEKELARLKEQNIDKNVTNENHILSEQLFQALTQKAKIDASDDTTLDFKEMRSFLATTPHISKSEQIKDGYFLGALSEPEYGIIKEEDKTEEIDNIQTSTISLNQTVFQPEIISFNLNYDANQVLNSLFMFDTKVARKNEDIDNMQEILQRKFDFEKNLMRFNIEQNLTARITGSVGLLKLFQNSSNLLSLSPVLSFSMRKSYDDIDIYEAYLKRRKTTTDDQNQIDKYSQQYANRNNSIITLKYNDSIKNDLSFGSFFLQGTNVTTTVAADLYERNEQTVFGFNLLNDLNDRIGNVQYEPIDAERYFNRRPIFANIQELSTKLNLMLNFIPSDYNHSLKLTTGPKFNLLLSRSSLNSLKDELWEKNAGVVKYLWSDVETLIHVNKKNDVNRLLDQAKEYVYFRERGDNLQKRVESFYYKEKSGKDASYRQVFESFV